MREGVGARRALALTGVTIAAAAAAVLPGKPVAAASGNSSQSVTATVVAGTLTVTAPPAITPTLVPGTGNANVALGTVAFTNTLNDGSAWSVTMTSTDWVNGANAIHFTDMSVTPGLTLGGGVGSTGTPTAGTGGTLSGTDGTPGTTASSPLTLATAASTVQGVYTQAGSTMSVTVPGGTPTGVYTGTITYTITG
ncbi:MAG TPA: hypothetical protein VFC09_06705 [Candidatus Dormibacteraeota bacterium]|nr:hypothetical protein [Candidatus Dormibacteraeota bacterium]